MENEKIIVQADPDMAEMVPWYLDKLKEYSTEIEEAIQKGDFETIQTNGHRMKGSGVNYGFDAISDIGRSLEQAAKDKSTEETTKWSGELSFFLEHVEVIY